MVSPSTKWLPISRIACRVAARTAGTPSRLASRPIVPCGVSPGWITRADMPSAQAEALTRNALDRSEEHTSELQSHLNLVCRLLLEKKKNTTTTSVHWTHTASVRSDT